MYQTPITDEGLKSIVNETQKVRRKLRALALSTDPINRELIAAVRDLYGVVKTARNALPFNVTAEAERR